MDRTLVLARTDDCKLGCDGTIANETLGTFKETSILAYELPWKGV